MGEYNELMRIGRKYTTKVDDALKEHNKRIKDKERMKGSPYYDDFLEKENERHITEIKVYQDTAIKEVKNQIKKMRENRDKHYIVEGDRSASVATLTMLNMVDDGGLTPAELGFFTKDMVNDPLAMKVVAQIGAKHHMRIKFPTIKDSDRALEVLQDNVIGYIERYNGFTPEDMTTKASLLRMERYFRSESGYDSFSDVKSSAQSDQQFWNDIVQVSSPDEFDSDDFSGHNADVKFYFKDVDELTAYIDKYTNGCKDELKEDLTNMILENCPNQYSAAYRNYKATGEKYPLHDDDELINGYGYPERISH